MPINFYGCFKQVACGSEDCSKIAKFWAKSMSYGHRSVYVDDIQRLSRFAQKGHNLWQIMSEGFAHWFIDCVVYYEFFYGQK